MDYIYLSIYYILYTIIMEYEYGYMKWHDN